MAAQPERRVLPIVQATPENFAPYGTILGDVNSASRTSNHYSAVRVVNPSTNFASDEDTCVLVLCYEPRGFECKFMERHYKHTQTFIPLEGKPLIGFFAPPNDKEEPDLDKVVCFRFEGNAGFVMHKGTWHEQPFPEQPGSKAVCILRNETVRELKPTDAATSECHGQDIDKLNLVARHNLIFTTEPGPVTHQETSLSPPQLPSATAEAKTVRAIPVCEATAENFAPYGTVLGDVDGASRSSQHYSAVRVVNPSKNFATDEDACVLVLCYEPRPLECKFMERHYKHTQTFIPLEGKPLIGFFAPPNDKDEPDLDKVVCFRFSGEAGFVMHKGTWHEQPFPEQPGSKAVCILRNETVRELKPTDPATSECHGQDIDKLNLVARHDLMFTAEVSGGDSSKRPRL